jgi:hypothetical protein
MAGDARYGLRTLRGEAVTSLFAIISIALGIGANLAIFSLIDALLLRSLSGVREPDRLVRIDVALPSTILDDFGKEAVFTGACGISTPLLTAEFHGEVEPVGVLSLAGNCAGARWRISAIMRSCPRDCSPVFRRLLACSPWPSHPLVCMG